MKENTDDGSSSYSSFQLKSIILQDSPCNYSFIIRHNKQYYYGDGNIKKVLQNNFMRHIRQKKYCTIKMFFYERNSQLVGDWADNQISSQSSLSNEYNQPRVTEPDICSNSSSIYVGWRNHMVKDDDEFRARTPLRKMLAMSRLRKLINNKIIDL